MHYVVFGAGAVGGVVGARLHLAGVPTTLVARGPHLTAVRRDGLVLDAADGPHRLEMTTAADAGEVRWRSDSVVLLAVKSQQTAAAVADLAEHAPTATPIVCLQNGVANEAVVLRRFARVHAVTVMLPATHLEPGVVVQGSAGAPGILDIGRFPAGTDEVDDAVAADLVAAGFASVARPDIMAWKHRKLLMNLGNGVDAAYEPGEAADDLADRCREEGETVLAAAGIAVTTADVDRDRRADLLRPRTDVMRHGGSTWQSVSRGLDTEIDHLAGEIVLLGRLHGVPTPANTAVQAAVHHLQHRGLPARSLPVSSSLR